MDSIISNSDPAIDESSLLKGSELDVHRIAAELGQMNMYLNNLELRLGTGVPTCPRQTSEPCEDAPQLMDSRNSRILKVQRNARKLQRQIGELFECSTKARKLMDELERAHCSVWQMRASVEQRCKAMDSIRREMDRDAALCLQRYNFLCRSRASWTESNNSAAEMKIIFDQILMGVVKKSAYRVDRKNVFKQLADVESVCVGATDELKQEVTDIGEFLDSLLDIQMFDSIISVDTAKRSLLDLEQERLQLLLQRPPFVSFSSEWHERMLKIIDFLIIKSN